MAMAWDARTQNNNGEYWSCTTTNKTVRLQTAALILKPNKKRFIVPRGFFVITSNPRVKWASAVIINNQILGSLNENNPLPDNL